MIEGLNAIVASPFVALLLALIACIFLWRLYTSERNANRTDTQKQWETVSGLAGGLKDNTAVTSRALDVLERRG